jgi:hypothetical protein
MSVHMSTPIPASSAPIDTAKVANRRILHFDTLDRLTAEVDRLVEAEKAGRLKQLGNWTLGQTLGHLACWMEYAYTPAPLKPPFFIRWILRLRRNSFLYKPMRPGVRIPGVAGGTLGTDPMPLDEALPRFRRVVERLKTEAPTAPSPAVGPCTHDEGIALNLRHAELHLGFLLPQR